ncbi:phosphate ABC transporter permease PstA [Microlunatus soli]|uniref:Phosphate transport system permease protein PstA n=1 Tax=Microlunatus soli TaxID=630515 RepID=A0A1H1SA12_9ACTN|nr:phosphate ABC transporter permease PstA [Microlunatus soli]SDS44149.1 phosphate ABC transporter membrane protein 2, PhoT family [Microlunatus soli]
MSTATDSQPPVSDRLDLSRPRGSRTARNLFATVLVTLATLLAIAPLVWILASVIMRGIGVVIKPGWWNLSQRNITALMDGGGAYAAIVGTVEIALICAVIAVPIGVLGAIYLVEYARGTRFARVISFAVDILTGIPSIVAALFIYAFVITILGFGRSAIAASFALVLLMLPTVLRSTEEMLKLVPDALREASYALGVPKWKTIVKVVVPTSLSGMVTGVLLGLARVMGETAPLLILVSYGQGINFNPDSSVMASLPTMINTMRDQPPGLPAFDRAWGAALTLILIVMSLNLIGRGISRFSKLKEK